MSKSTLAVSVLMLLALASVAVADEGFYVTVYNGEDPQDGARVELWRWSSVPQDWVKETEAYTANGGVVTFYQDHPVEPCDIPHSGDDRKLRAFYGPGASDWSDVYVYDHSDDYFEVDLYLITE